MNRTLIGVAVTAACSAPSPPVQPSAPPPVTPSGRCELVGELEPKPWPTVDELFGVLDQPLDSPRVAAIAERLGTQEQGALFQVLAAGGVELHGGGYGDDIRVARVILRGENWPRYGGELPGGLRFSHDREELLRRLGAGDSPTGCEQGTGWCLYLDRGVAVDASNAWAGCVRKVVLFPAIPRGGARIGTVTVELENGAMRGFNVHVRGRSGSLPPDRSWQVSLQLHTAGAPVTEASWVGGTSEAGQRIAFERTFALGAPGMDEWSAAWFVPYVALDLRPGVQPVVVEVTARTTARGDADSPSGPLATAHTELALDMPPVTQIRFGVRELVVAPGDYDVNGVVDDQPELTWMVSYGDYRVHRSPARRGLRARWDRSISWLRVASGDRISLRFEDEDVIAHDPLGALWIDPDRVRSLAGEVLRPGGRVTSVRLGDIRQRAVAAKDRTGRRMAPERRVRVDH